MSAVGFESVWCLAMSLALLTPPAVMILTATAIFLVLKVLVLVHFERSERRAMPLVERLAWLCTWPGMNASHFFTHDATISKPAARAWLGAIGKVLLGGLLLGVAAPWVTERNELAGGWVALVGFAFLLHFGSLQISALLWRRAGRPVEKIMVAPVLATSLSEFWSDRWNLAFRDFARTFVFRPLARRFGTATGVLGGFVFSGLIHDLAISLPARGGYGLPTAYFLLQSAGVFAERSAWGRQIGLGRGWRGWLFAATLIAPAAFFLFHPPFIREVIVPLIPSGVGSLFWS
jgi:hypothetical protein